MPKEKMSLYGRIKHWFTYHPFFKVVSLILAIITWLYVKGEIK